MHDLVELRPVLLAAEEVNPRLRVVAKFCQLTGGEHVKQRDVQTAKQDSAFCAMGKVDFF